MIRTAPPVPRRVLDNRSLTVVAAPADTGYTIRLENAGAGLAQCRLRGGQELTGRDIFRLPGAQPGHPTVHVRAQMESAMSLSCRPEQQLRRVKVGLCCLGAGSR
jgi:hypothetical protein